MKQWNKKQYKYIAYIAAYLCIIILTTACGDSGSSGNDAGVDTNINTSVDTNVDSSELFSNRDISGEYDASKCDSIVLSDTGCTTDSKNVTIDQTTITITGEGDYMVSGALSDGMIIVDVDKSEKVQLVLNGVTINSASSAAIYVRKADKVFVTLADGTENILENGGTFEAIDDNNIDAVIFSKDDLTLNGTGSLIVRSPSAHGIVSKDELVITNGNYNITAASHGLTGKDSVAIADGSFEIVAGEDAIKSVNDDDETLGSVYILDGSYTLTAQSDGVNALNEINISGGTLVIEKPEEGLEARVINISGGEIDITSTDDGLNATDKRTSASEKNTDENAADKKGFGGGGMGDAQSDASIHISGGIVRIDAEGDGIDSNGYLTVSGGEVYVTGPSHGGDAALDYGIDASISGGIVVAAGQSGMAQNFGSDSTQGSILVNTQEQNASGSSIILLDSDGSELVAWTLEKSYNSVTISCPEIVDGGSYTLKMGETSTEITMEGLIYGQSSSHGGGKSGFQDGERPEGMPDHSDFKNGERPEGMPEPPDFQNGREPEGIEPLDFQNGVGPKGDKEG